MDFLRGNATASPVGLFVICRFLSGQKQGFLESELARALQELRRSDSDDSSGVLTASLAVGRGLGLLERDGRPARWRLSSAGAGHLKDKLADWTAFRAELAHQVATGVLAEEEYRQGPPDLVMGLTWFLQSDPLDPPSMEWTVGTEARARKIGLQALDTVEQWRAFQRWAVALGMARRSGRAASLSRLIPDASTAIADQFGSLPRDAGAREWLAALRARVPVFGDSETLKFLPKGPEWETLPGGVALGLLKLEKSGMLSLKSSDDASDVIVVGLGDVQRQVGRIAVEA